MITRFENKYIISIEYHHLLLKELLNYGEIDHHCSEHRPYDVYSQYYDTPQLNYYYQKIEGEYQHVKVRKRSYSTKFDENQTFVEVKLKANDLIYKHRCLVNEMNTQQNIVQSIVNFNQLLPTAKIYYQRSALYIKTSIDQYRITFDQNIMALLKDDVFENLSHNEERLILSKNAFLLEIKSTKNHIPRWLMNLFHNVGAKKVSFSKYANGMSLLLKNRGI